MIADLVDIARLSTADAACRVPYLAYQPSAIQDLPVLAIDDVQTCHYLRLGVADQAGVLANVTGVLAECGISIDAMLQQPAAHGLDQTELIILTHVAQDRVMNAAIQKIQQLPTVLKPVIRIRKEDLS